MVIMQMQRKALEINANPPLEPPLEDWWNQSQRFCNPVTLIPGTIGRA